MKNLIIFALILAAGASAYPQATRTARESKNDKGSSRSESSSRTVKRSESKASDSKKSSPEKPSTVQRSRTADYSQHAATRSSDRQSSNRSSQEVKRSTDNRSRETVSTNRASESRSQSGAVESQRPPRTQTQVVRKYGTDDQSQNRNNRVARPDEKRSDEGIRRASGDNNRSDNQNSARVNSSSASRVYRESKNALTREDGSVIRHQNDDVFASRRYNLNYDNYEALRRSDDFRREYRDYDNWNHRRHIRIVNHYHYRYVPIPLEVRRVRYVYRHPVHINLIWTPTLLHRFMYYYPTHNYWDIDFGREIETISAYDAQDYVGSVKRVYGKVEEVYYSPEDENYMLYIGAPFPYHDISVVVPRHIAQDITRSPKWYFENEHVWVVGLINQWEGKPEIVVRDEDQIRRY